MLVINIKIDFGLSDVSQLSQIFPVVEMVLENGQKLSLSAENYMFRVSKKVVCLFYFLFSFLLLLSGERGRGRLSLSAFFM